MTCNNGYSMGDTATMEFKRGRWLDQPFLKERPFATKIG